MKFYRNLTMDNFRFRKRSIVIGALVIYCMTLLIIRVLLTERSFGLFMVWNLFLAILPLIISNYLSNQITSTYTSRSFSIKRKAVMLFLLLTWLLLIPNAPYLLTDLIHIAHGDHSLIFYDTAMYGGFALVGLTVFCSSINEIGIFIQSFFRIKNGIKLVTIESVIILLTSLGIYLGRVLRFNSWDVLTVPDEIIEEIIVLFMNPKENLMGWAIIGPMFLLLTLLHLLRNHKILFDGFKFHK